MKEGVQGTGWSPEQGTDNRNEGEGMDNQET